MECSRKPHRQLGYCGGNLPRKINFLTSLQLRGGWGGGNDYTNMCLVQGFSVLCVFHLGEGGEQFLFANPLWKVQFAFWWSVHQYIVGRVIRALLYVCSSKEKSLWGRDRP